MCRTLRTLRTLPSIPEDREYSPPTPQIRVGEKKPVEFGLLTFLGPWSLDEEGAPTADAFSRRAYSPRVEEPTSLAGEEPTLPASLAGEEPTPRWWQRWLCTA